MSGHFPSRELAPEYLTESPCGWIQWQGTDACIDFYCTCGAHMHADRDFLFHIKCSACDQVWEVGGHVKLYPLDHEPENTITLVVNK